MVDVEGVSVSEVVRPEGVGYEVRMLGTPSLESGEDAVVLCSRRAVYDDGKSSGSVGGTAADGDA